MNPTPQPISILIIEDNPADLFLIQDMLEGGNSNFKIYTAGRLSAGCGVIIHNDINLVLLDLSLPDSFGIDSFLEVKKISKKIAVIILTGLDDAELARHAISQGAQDYLVKGEFNTDALKKSIQYSIERKNAEEKLAMSEEKYRHMFYKNPFPAIIYDQGSLQILEVNDSAILKYGYAREAFLALRMEDIRPEKDIPEFKQQIADFKTSDQLQGKIWRHKKKNGALILVEVTSYQIDYLGISAIQEQINDVTEKIFLEEELAKQRIIKQQQITGAVLDAQEQERKGIGEELHDNINQILATAKLFLTTSLQKPDMQLICKSRDYISMAMEEIRKLSSILITPAFMEAGLKGPIEDLVENILEATKMDITTEINIPYETILDEDMKVTIYRIIQEQLNNILKHAEATTVSIAINASPAKIVLSIHDNGKGFDTHLNRKGIGISNIRRRAEVFNGKVAIESSPGKGCLLSVILYKKVGILRQVTAHNN